MGTCGHLETAPTAVMSSESTGETQLVRSAKLWENKFVLLTLPAVHSGHPLALDCLPEETFAKIAVSLLSASLRAGSSNLNMRFHSGTH